MSVRRLIGAASAVGVFTAASLFGVSGLAFAQEEEEEVKWFTFNATGSGDEEVPAGTGEKGTALVGSISLAEDGRMTYTIMVQGNEEELAAAHIHRGSKGENGGVVITLDLEAIRAKRSAEVQIDVGLARRIINNPGNWYINTHSESFQPPTGIARGQLVGEDDAEKPDRIDTGTGGQFAATQSRPDAGTIAAGALLIASAAGGAFVLRRRSGTDNA